MTIGHATTGYKAYYDRLLGQKTASSVSARISGRNTRKPSGGYGGLAGNAMIDLMEDISVWNGINSTHTSKSVWKTHTNCP
jgi:hypothetical protein